MTVIFSIFAGRQKYLDVLFYYTDQLLANKIIDEVHLWQFTSNASDIAFMNNKATTNSQYKTIVPSNIKSWTCYYRYYAYNILDNDIVIKCDDDIVYIDVKQFSYFLQAIPDNAVCFPNIINNDICAYFQSKYGVHSLFDYSLDNSLLTSRGNCNPATSWYLDYQKAHQIHTLFLNNPSQFIMSNVPDMVEYGNRISINLFGVKGNHIKLIFPHIGDNDEGDFATIARNYGMHKICLLCNIVHFQFGPQNADNKLDTEFLNQYKQLTMNE